MQTGQQVVCINDAWEPWVFDFYKALPVKGKVYTLRDISPGKSNPNFGLDEQARLIMSTSDYDIRVTLVELINPMDPSTNPPQELGFKSDRFAELESAEATWAAQLTDELPRSSKQLT
jgi:hypothetical protein